MKTCRKYLFFNLFCVLVLYSCHNADTYTHLSGFVQGTTYSIIYQGTEDFQQEIELLLAQFDSSLSVYNPQSIISKFNRNEEVLLDSFFINCFVLAQQAAQQTYGAFDISAGPLFEAWGFGGKKERRELTNKQVDSLKQFCGMHNVCLQNNRLVKNDSRLQLNANAIAKGYSVDVVAKYLEQKGKRNYLVEIGGEIFVQGVNAKGKLWTVGIDTPADGNMIPGASLAATLQVSNRGLATSGNYRKFYEQNGKKITHTIDPVSGYPVQHNLLSATVLASSCGLADALATAFMVVGVDSAKQILASNPQFDAILIFAVGDELDVYITPNIADAVRQKFNAEI
ncbi:MAG: FAD:protein FMN transferase [Bacteroidales bacterium]